MKKNSADKPLLLDRATAVAIALSAQGLDRSAAFGKGKKGALETIRHLGYVQLDTLAVVARAHHHTLWSRTKAYSEEMLNSLMRDKSIFEYWSHAAAYLPMEDFRFSLVRKQEFLNGRSHWFQKDKKVMKYVLDRIRAEGPLQSKDFETDRARGSWFDWKPAKIALEQLFQDGTLMVTERKGFQKIYDLADRVIPVGIDTTLPTKEEFAEHLVHAALRAHGIASLKDMTHLRRGMLPHVTKMLQQLVKKGTIVRANIEKVKGEYYLEKKTIAGHRFNDHPEDALILSPFDNAVIRRERLQQLFDYDYTIECYLPEPKRKFGYFCLPVLYKGNFIGRFDPKADRATKTFIVKKFYLENPPQQMDEFLHAFAATLKSFAAFNGCEKIVVEKVFPAKYAAAIKRALK